MNSVVLVSVATVLVAVLFLSQRSVAASPWLQLLKPLLPTWRFFEGSGYRAKIQWRESESNEWQELKAQRFQPQVTSLFANADWNVHLAFLSQVERLLNEISEAESVESIRSTVSFGLVCGLIWSRLPESASGFQIVLNDGTVAVSVDRGAA